MSLYDDLTDEQLAAKIGELRTAYEKAIGGGVATVIAGEGRRVEYSRANSDGLSSLLKAAQRERDKRNGVQTEGAISVVFPYGDGGFYYG